MSEQTQREHIDKLIRVMRATMAAVLIGFAVGAYAIVALVNRNSKAIEVSCVMLANVATQSGAGGHGNEDDLSPAARKQREITTLAFKVLTRAMTLEETKEFATLNAELQMAGGFVELPKCSQVAKHPETVTQVGTQTAQEKP